MSENFDLNILADYYATQPEFTNVQITNNGVPINPGGGSGSSGSGSTSPGFSFEQQINLLNLSVGLAIKL